MAIGDKVMVCVPNGTHKFTKYVLGDNGLTKVITKFIDFIVDSLSWWYSLLWHVGVSFGFGL